MRLTCATCAACKAMQLRGKQGLCSCCQQSTCLYTVLHAMQTCSEPTRSLQLLPTQPSLVYSGSCWPCSGLFPSASNGIHVGDFLLGLVLSVLIGGVAFFILRSNAFRRFSRHQKAAAVDVSPSPACCLMHAFRLFSRHRKLQLSTLTPALHTTVHAFCGASAGT